MIKIKIAENNQKNSIAWFFQENLNKNNKAIYSREFFCPFGLKKAVQEKNVAIVEDDEGEIIAGVRFYLRQGDNVVSIYQFAIKEKNKKQNLLKKMLKKTGHKKFEVLCPIDLEFNNYYKKTNWLLLKKEKNFNHWILDIK